ncbi:DUF6527 family protein [Pseudomonas batumici]|uniref:DUF6527 family protein n=1 Tax=Pseudomonas batumici TaxID=226910 RepID=UPI0030D57807
MSEIKTIGRALGQAVDGSLWFFCDGCDSPHSLQVGAGPGPRWGYNGNPDAPTFTPSVLVNWPANPEACEALKEWRTERVCHSFVTDGRIQYLGDSTHSLAGQMVDLPNWEESWERW